MFLTCSNLNQIIIRQILALILVLLGFSLNAQDGDMEDNLASRFEDNGFKLIRRKEGEIDLIVEDRFLDVLLLSLKQS